jgi:predicted methyltransferase
MSNWVRNLGIASLLCLPLACEKSSETVTPDEAPPADAPVASAAQDAGKLLSDILAGDHRDAKNPPRDEYRHPIETLTFFGIQQNHTVVELWAGGGWYTEVLAPLLRDEGRLIVAQYSKTGPEDSYRPRVAKKFEEKLQAHADVYDKVEVVEIPEELPFELAAEGSVDMVLTFRNSHGWFRKDEQEKVYGMAFKALKPGGVFGVVQHRANADVADPKASAEKGYVPEAAVISAAEAAGFQLAEKSEINANPKDTKDHPEGVWSLPPSLDVGDAVKKDAPEEEKAKAKEEAKAKYGPIGESDRMTLKFVKPAN